MQFVRKQLAYDVNYLFKNRNKNYVFECAFPPDYFLLEKTYLIQGLCKVPETCWVSRHIIYEMLGVVTYYLILELWSNTRLLFEISSFF